ncbi:MAG: ADOP family duplicated permease [Gemmatimonadales bacterium]
MSLVELLRRTRLFFFRDRATRELEAEMRFHREMRAEALHQAGMSATDATSSARRRFGHPVRHQEASRDTWGLGSLDDLRQDIRYAVRRLRQRPAFTVSVVAVLALGIGATTAMFSAVDAAMLRPLPFVRPAELLSLNDIQFPFDMAYALGHPTPFAGVRSRELRIADLQQMPDVFSHVGGYAAGALDLRDAARPERLRIGMVTPDLFATLGVRTLEGRPFTVAEGAPAGPAVAIVSFDFWQRQYSGREVLNHIIRLGGQSYTVVGIMPRGFSFPEASDAWIPLVLPMSPDVQVPLRGVTPSHVVARMAPGVTAATAVPRLLLRWQQALTPPGLAKVDKWASDELEERRAGRVAVPLQEALVGDRSTALMFLFGATGILLMISITNAASLLLSQVSVRRREVAVREVLGAGRGRVLRQLLTESVLLALTSGVLGIALADAFLGGLRPLLPTGLAGLASTQLDLRVLGVAVALAIAVGIVSGAWPAVRSTANSPSEVIKSGGYAGTNARAGHGRRALVGAEVMLTVLLMVGAGLLLRSSERLTGADRGMALSHTGSLEIAFPLLPTPRDIWDTLKDFSSAPDIWGLQRHRASVNEMLGRLTETPGIDAAALVDAVPLSGADDGRLGGVATDIFVGREDNPVGAGRDLSHRKLVRAHAISDNYFAAMGIPLRAGRTFIPADDSTAPLVAVISEQVARKYFSDGDPVGRTLRLGLRDSKPFTVVGVAGNISERGITNDTFPQIYTPIAQQKVPPFIAFVARGHLTPPELLNAMQNGVHAVDPLQAVYNVLMMPDVVRASTEQWRTNTRLALTFALLALALAIFGTWAVVASGVSRRKRELGIRSALGASGPDLTRLIAREMALVLGVCIALGVVVSWTLARLTSSLIYGVTIHDPATFVLAPVVVLVPAALATILPARRAARVNPAEVMRAE